MKTNKSSICAVLASAIVFSVIAAPASAAQRGKNGVVAISSENDGEDAYVQFLDASGNEQDHREGWWETERLVGMSFEPGVAGQDLFLTTTFSSRLYRTPTTEHSAKRLYRTRGAFTLSPDGERAAFTFEPRYDKPPDLVLANKSGNYRRVLLTAKELGRRITELAWSPDGREIAFVSSDGTEDNYSIHRIDIVSGEVTDLGPGNHPDWSPDGATLVFESIDSPELLTMDADGGNRQVLVENGWDPTWSPDGEVILFSRGENYFTISTEGLLETPFTTHEDPELADDIAWQATCTITAKPSGGKLVGTPGDDFICGRGGHDIIYGGGGNDTILGGGGGDVVRGGPGRDILNGEEGRDQLLGSDGHDVLVDVHGSDVLKGEAGSDHLHTRDRGPDTVYGGQGSDACWVNTSKDTATSC